VTIYGFHQNDLPLVLKEFSKCGDIVEFGSFDDGPYVNWTHVCYESKYAAQRALLRSGQQLSPTCMVGVKEMDEKKRDAIEQGTSLEDRRSRVPVIPPVLPTLDIDKKKAIAAVPVVPLSSTSMWEKVCEFVLGI
jgi:nuclear pore complex protein Nup53